LGGFAKILIVDDNPDVLGLVACMLTMSGFNVITAGDGLLGLEIAEAELPDLIITDISMPRLDGIQMISRLRDQSQFSKVPILVISAHGSAMTTEALRAGANKAMHKPLDFDSFISHVNNLLAA
jgi:DNA-binding response OmpR family regulator